MMNDGQFLTLLLAILGHTAALVWWAATLTSTVKHHERQLSDHERRLREGDL